MLSEDPLSNIAVLPKIDSVRSNRCGRPRSSDTILFCPQPASIISTKIREEMKLQMKGTCNVISKHDIKCEEVSSITQSDYDNSNIIDTYMSPANETNYNYSCEITKCGEPPVLKEKVCGLWDNFADQKDCIRKNYCKSRNQSNNLLLENGVTKYSCDFESCTYSTNISTNLTKHKRKHTKEKPYICDSCTFRSNFASSLKAHRRIHTNERPYQCEYCVYCCNSSSNLKKHTYHRHRIKNKMRDETCEST